MTSRSVREDFLAVSASSSISTDLFSPRAIHVRSRRTFRNAANVLPERLAGFLRLPVASSSSISNSLISGCNSRFTDSISSASSITEIRCLRSGGAEESAETSGNDFGIAILWMPRDMNSSRMYPNDEKSVPSTTSSSLRRTPRRAIGSGSNRRFAHFIAVLGLEHWIEEPNLASVVFRASRQRRVCRGCNGRSTCWRARPRTPPQTRIAAADLDHLWIRVQSSLPIHLTSTTITTASAAISMSSQAS